MKNTDHNSWVLREEILYEHSKQQCSRIVQWVGSDQQRFDTLFHLFTTDEYRVVQRAAWPVSYCVQNHPFLIRKHLKKLFDLLQKAGLHDAVKRNAVRLLADMDIPKKYQGIAMDTCFRLLQFPSETVAVKVFSMTVLHHLSEIHPDIRPELELTLREQWTDQSAGFKSRARKIIGKGKTPD